MNTRTSQSGASLIEIIVTMFMIFVLLILYVSALNTATLTRKLRYENIAYHVANKQMESLRATALDSLPSSGSISDPQLSQIPSGSGNFTVDDYPGFGGMKEIVVTVTWDDGQPKQTVFRTLAGSGGINP
jgi:competence protein ComGC